MRGYIEEKMYGVRFVYLIRCYLNEELPLYKIGISNKVKLRLKQFTTGNPADLTLMCMFPSNQAPKVEAALHNLFKNKNIQGEWFELSYEDVTGFLNLCLTLEKGFDALNDNNNPFF
jgi:hypothetical protein